MAKDNEGQALRDYGNRKKRYRRRRMFIICTLLLIIVAIGSVYLYRLYNRNYQSYEVMKTQKIPGGQDVGYLKYGTSIVRYNKDGVEAIDKNGKTLWNGAYEMIDPIADTCGKYVVVADRGSKLIHIYNDKGDVGSITTLHNIIKVEVASQGVVAALMEDGENNYIKLYNPDGSVMSEGDEDDVLAEKVSDVNVEGYPIDISLSDDGKKLVTVFMSVTTGQIVSTVGFYNFDEVGQNYIDNFVGGFKFEGIVIPEVAFLGNDTVCVYKENGFLIYSMPEKPKLIHEEKVNQKIDSVFHNDKYTGLVLSKDASSSKRLELYDLKGKRVLNKKINFEYDRIVLSGEEIILYDNLSCLILKTNGKEKFNYTFDGNIDAIYPINDLDRYFLVSDKSVKEVVLKE